MKLEITKSINLNNYSVQFSVVDLNPTSEELLQEFGIPSINIGGDIPITLDTGATTFKISEEIKKFPTDFPFTKTFKDAHYNGKGKEYANAYIAEIKKRVDTVMEALHAKVDDFSGTEVIEL